MIDYNPGGSGDLDAIKADGSKLTRDPLTQQLTFPGAGTWYVEVGSDDAFATAMTSLSATHFAWSAAFAAIITVQSCNFPGGSVRKSTGPADVSSIDVTSGNWIPESSATNVPTDGSGGNTSVGLTVTAGGANAGGCIYHLGNDGARRKRFKIVVTVGGTCRINRRAKNAA